MSTAQPKQAVGQFTMNMNYRRNNNPKAPAITGRVSTPENPDAVFEFSAWQHRDQEGKPYWIGPVSRTASVRQALLKDEPERGTHFLTIRLNEFKVFKEDEQGHPNAAYFELSEADRAKHDKMPSYWGSWTREAGEPTLKLAAWDREGRYGPWASGNTQHPKTKEELEAMKRGVMPDQASFAMEPAQEPERKRAAGRSR